MIKTSTKSSFLVMVFSTTIFFSFLLLFVPLEAQILCNQNDKDSLLQFSYSLSSNSLNWSTAVDCCSWEGVECDGHDGRVVGLRLPSRGLVGVLSPSLANLTRLSHLNLSRNRLSSSLPVGLLSGDNGLAVVDLSYNRLSGELPLYGGSVAKSPVEVVDLSSNLFSGEINPDKMFLQAAWNLTVFNVSNNSFTGLIPSGVCLYSSGSVRVLDFSYNDFSGVIPSGLGNCSGLRILRAGFNSLSGLIPDDIYRAILLDHLSFPVNHLSGGISNSIRDLTNLKILELYSNELTGTIPMEIGKLSLLEKLLLHINNLTGSIPPSLMNCTRINTLNLRVNSLGGDLSAFDFSTMSKLSILDLGNNKFTGNFPASLYSCTSLTAVRLATNQIQGQILPEIRALQSLSFLSVSNNSLTNATGAIQILMGCRNLTTMVLANNFMYEAIPDNINTLDMPGFDNIRVLGLGGCQFSGTIPSWLGKIRNLEVLDLSINRLSGPVPRWLGNLSSLFYFDLSSNRLSGELPIEITRMTALVSNASIEEIKRTYLELPVFVMPNNATNQQYNQLSNLPPAIYFGNNSLSGSIPVEIGQLKYLLVLDLSRNSFSGTIPDEISNLTNLEKLDLSGNDLSGEIPTSLRGLHFLSLFNVANNNLQGPIPSGNQFETFQSSSFVGNPGLCGPILHRSCSNPTRTDSVTRSQPRVNTKLLVGLLVSICSGSGLLLALLVTWILSKRRIIPGEDTDKIEMDMISSNSFSIVPIDSDKDTCIVILFPNNGEEIKDLTMAELLKATDNFNQANIVGCGGFGLVYKATLANGTKLAVKKLSGDFGMMEREFRAEVEALSTAQHENLVSLQGYCVYEGFRLLIYSFMENGSLDYWLHEKVDGASQLDWPTRLKIARGASCGLAYMHQICEPHIIHRDIKSSNILLDEKFEAHVADFGLARLILPYHTHVTTELVGTLGYIPPEYGQAWVATFRGDIYSFGVVMLELLTGKRPVEVMKPKTRELVSWVQQMRNDGKQDQIYDQVLRGKGYEDEMLQVLDVACLCVNQNPVKRPTIKQVVDWLKNVGSQRDQDQSKQSNNTNHERM